MYLFLFLIGLFAFKDATYAQGADKPYVLLISLDGFGHDYVERFKPVNISSFISEGTAAESLIPSFPTKTFPNHYTIATGMKPEHHGLVDNSFYDPVKNVVYSMGNRELIQDGYWYGGTPLWVLAEQNGIKAASYFFVGSESPIQDVRPSYYFDYDGSVPNLSRISQVFEWLQLPEDERPQLITMYFSDMDDVGHRFGPSNDKELRNRLEKLDHELGSLFEGLKSLDLDLHIILVSDHGMVDVGKDKLINLDKLTEGIDARIVNNGALAHVHLNDPKTKRKVVKTLQKRAGNFTVADVSDRGHYIDIDAFPERIGDLLILPDLGYYLADEKGLFNYQNRAARFGTEVFGEHGFSPEYKEMHGIFYAKGSSIKRGLRIESFENYHIYPLICGILGLPVPDGIDGEREVLAPVLVD